MDINSFCVFATLLIATPVVIGAVHLRPVSVIYIPYSYSGSVPSYGIDMAAVEQSAYDVTDRIMYAAGDNYIHIIDFGDLVRPAILRGIPLSTLANDIEMCGDYVAVAQQGFTATDIGKVAIYEKFSRATGSFNKVAEIEVGYKPDMLHFTHDCSKIVVANEGEAAESYDGSSFINPEGSVSILKATGNPYDPYSAITLGFDYFNQFASEYEMYGVRQPYKGQLTGETQTMAQNLEPEYVTFSSDERTAYVCLQENNAIAIVDLVMEEIAEIVPLGSKSWNSLLIDASDKDGGIMFKSYDIYSYYQPDSIKTININNHDYIITANEGDSFSYTFGKDEWEEFDRGEDVRDDGRLGNSISNDLEDQLNSDPDLGRLQISVVDDLDSNGNIERVNFYGARGISIFDAETLSLIYDSGDEIERKMAVYYPEVFNGNTKCDDAGVDKPSDSFDGRSDNQGPECESLETGNLNGKTVLFVGIDRSAAIAIYSFAPGSVIPTFESIYRAGGVDDTFENLLNGENLGDLDPEDLKFVPASDSITNTPLLFVTSTVSGTISVYEVVDG